MYTYPSHWFSFFLSYFIPTLLSPFILLLLPPPVLGGIHHIASSILLQMSNIPRLCILYFETHSHIHVSMETNCYYFCLGSC